MHLKPVPHLCPLRLLLALEVADISGEQVLDALTNLMLETTPYPVEPFKQRE